MLLRGFNRIPNMAKIEHWIRTLSLSLTLFLAAGCAKHAEITGTVTFGAVNPQPLANVAVGIPGTQFNTVTNQQGEYTIPYVPGSFLLTFSAPGFLTKHVPYNISQPTVVPAEAVSLIAMPNQQQWENYLLQTSQQNPVAQQCNVVTVSIISIDPESDQTVIAKVRSTFHTQYGVNLGFNTPNLAGQDSHDPGTTWSHDSRIRLQFQPPNTWSWVQTLSDQ
jgi:hypothetical protein